ncbi:OppA family ABC transporter substrate-binding lipoprotein [Mycoplasmopsis felis]|uniref:OppA family ABC transporter substrate-binding lipoprotein n=1 Tax=Mycoplasmopsis felis TaxID=33923 RepID=UPI002AFF41E8|nr:hypothetical protein [Mycoplasmopsis felis]WQQ04947.1 hypothetical protein RRG55_01275 [Mycoplasmopsis felis]
MKRRKLLLLGTVLSVVAGLSTVVSCGTGEKTRREKAEVEYSFVELQPGQTLDTSKYQTTEELKNIVLPKIKFNNNLSNTFNINAFNYIYETQVNIKYSPLRSYYDSSYSTGSYSGRESDNVIGQLIEKEYYGRPEIVENVTLDPSKNLEKVTTRKINKPSVSRWSLQLADAIVLTIDGTEKVYDSDSAELLVKPDEADGTYSTSLVELKSQNPRSINNPQFSEDLLKATKVAFRIRKNNFWVNSKGEKTSYKVVPEDFYLGILRTYLSDDSSYRINNGGSAELDKLANQKYAVDGTNHFKENKAWGNKYLYDLYNVNLDKILNKEQSVIRNSTGEYFTLERKNENESSGFKQLLTGVVYGSYDFSPAPYEYIQEVSTTNQYPDFYKDSSDLTQADKTDILNKVKNVSSLAREAGIYWYGLSSDSSLFSGKYYAAGYNADTTTDSYKLNTHYFDKSYVENPRTIESFNVKYFNSELDPSAFSQLQFNQFKAGSIASLSYSSLSESNKHTVQNDRVNYGLENVQTRNEDGSTGLVFPELVPTKQKSDNEEEFVNEAYAKLVWGTSLEEIKKGTAKNTLKASTSGMGQEFKQILSAAVNWSKVAEELVKPNDALPWINGFAQDVKITDNEEDRTVENNALRPNYVKVNTLFVVDSESNQKVDLGGNIGTELDPTESNSVNKQSADVYKSDAFPELQKRMKALLDKFFAENTNVGNTVEFTSMSIFSNYNPNYKTAHEEQVKVLNALDPRLKVHYRFETQRGPFINYYFNSTIPFRRSGWGYDFNLTAGGFDGLSFYQSNLIQVLSLINNDEEYKNALTPAYPTLVKVAGLFKEYITKHNVQWSIPETEWNKLGNEYEQEFYNFINEYKLNPSFNSNSKITETNQRLVQLSEEEKKQYRPAGEITGKFWLYLGTEASKTGGPLTKLDWLNLIQETRNLIGVFLGLYGTLKEPFTQSLVNPNFVRPAILDKAENMRSYQVVLGK